MLEFKPPTEARWVIIAIIGGIIKFLDSYLKGEEVGNVWHFLALILVSGFAGWMTASMVSLYNPAWVTIGAGIGGFTGTKVIQVVMEYVNVRLGLRESKNQTTEPSNDEIK